MYEGAASGVVEGLWGTSDGLRRERIVRVL